MPVNSTFEVTELLQKWSGGDADALEELTPVIYDELYRIAKSYMRRERKGILCKLPRSSTKHICA